jgi:hypothetical protein
MPPAERVTQTAQYYQPPIDWRRVFVHPEVNGVTTTTTQQQQQLSTAENYNEDEFGDVRTRYGTCPLFNFLCNLSPV